MYVVHTVGVVAAGLSFLRIPLREGEFVSRSHRAVFGQAFVDLGLAILALVVPTAVVALFAPVGPVFSGDTIGVMLLVLAWFAVNGVAFAMWRHSLVWSRTSVVLRSCLSWVWLTAMGIFYILGFLFLRNEYDTYNPLSFEEMMGIVALPEILCTSVGLVCTLFALRSIGASAGNLVNEDD